MQSGWRPGDPIDPSGSWSSAQIHWLSDTPEGRDQMRRWNKPPPWRSPLGGSTMNDFAQTLAPVDKDWNFSAEQMLPWNAGLLGRLRRLF